MKYIFELKSLPNSANKGSYISIKYVSNKKGGKYMRKFIKKIVEKYARSSTNSCSFYIIHQPKAPRCLIEK